MVDIQFIEQIVVKKKNNMNLKCMNGRGGITKQILYGVL